MFWKKYNHFDDMTAAELENFGAKVSARVLLRIVLGLILIVVMLFVWLPGGIF